MPQQKLILHILWDKKKKISIELKALLLRKALLKFHELIMELERDDFSFI